MATKHGPESLPFGEFLGFCKVWLSIVPESDVVSFGSRIPTFDGNVVALVKSESVFYGLSALGPPRLILCFETSRSAVSYLRRMESSYPLTL